jgi:hypothetical protein
MKVKLTLENLYGRKIITYQNISLLCKLDQCMDNFQYGQQATKKNAKVYITKKFKIHFARHD